MSSSTDTRMRLLMGLGRAGTNGNGASRGWMGLVVGAETAFLPVRAGYSGVTEVMPARAHISSVGPRQNPPDGRNPGSRPASSSLLSRWSRASANMAAMLLRRLRWGLAGVLVAWTVIRAFGLERGWPLVPLLTFTPHLTVLAVLGAALAAWRRWWAGAAVGAACAAVLIALLAPRAIPNDPPAGAAGVRLRVLSMNIAGDAAAARDVLRQIRGWKPDVVSLLE